MCTVKNQQILLKITTFTNFTTFTTFSIIAFWNPWAPVRQVSRCNTPDQRPESRDTRPEIPGPEIQDRRRWMREQAPGSGDQNYGKSGKSGKSGYFLQDLLIFTMHNQLFNTKNQVLHWKTQGFR